MADGLGVPSLDSGWKAELSMGTSPSRAFIGEYTANRSLPQSRKGRQETRRWASSRILKGRNRNAEERRSGGGRGGGGSRHHPALSSFASIRVHSRLRFFIPTQFPKAMLRIAVTPRIAVIFPFSMRDAWLTDSAPCEMVVVVQW